MMGVIRSWYREHWWCVGRFCWTDRLLFSPFFQFFFCDFLRRRRYVCSISSGANRNFYRGGREEEQEVVVVVVGTLSTVEAE